MKLTSEQAEVVALSSGRHLVLAPPGSGKTEMLSRRIIGAAMGGVDPSRMLCATFTNRAAFEMRDRVTRDGGGVQLPDVGNLHHFCHAFLLSVGRIHPGRHVLDEVQQQEFVKEVVDALRRELRECAPTEPGRSFGVTVIKGVKGVCGPSADDACRGRGEINRARVEFVRRLFEDYIADALDHDRNPYAEMLSGVTVSHQRRVGIPSRLVCPFPPQVAELASEGVIDGLERAYSGLKRKFRSVDFDDLLNDAYLFLEAHPLPAERRFSWVQIDEVQDLSPLQWHIVKNLTAEDAVSVYFGDVEQAIFSFLGASAGSFLAATADCERHCFRRNFRATPILLEVLMRYSLDALASEWEFLPSPSDPSAGNGVLELSVGKLARGKPGIRDGFDFGPVASRADRMLRSGTAENVAVLVRTNKAADMCESWVKRLGWRYAKVSGVDLFAYAPMRDFMAFVSLFSDKVPMTAWATLARRFSRTVFSRAYARYFVRGMFASGWNPLAIHGEDEPVGLLPSGSSRAALWAWRHRRAIVNMRTALRPAWQKIASRLGGKCTLREVFDVFAEVAFEGPALYSSTELSPNGLVDGDGKKSRIPYSAGIRMAKERIEKFLRYTDHVYANDSRPLGQILAEDWSRLSKLKEADLLVGDEKIVISTIHKAKGRQFDAVFIPSVKDVVECPLSDPDEARRLLYVAMSRARRHLLMWEADEPSVLPLKQCFAQGYENYYVRRERGDDLSGDWLSEWESLAEMNARRDCDDKAALAAAKSDCAPVACMAMRALRWSRDEGLRRRIYLEAIGEAGTKSETARRAISCLRDCGMFSEEESAQVRDAALRSESAVVARAALGYFAGMAERSRAAALDAIGDFLYSRHSEIRVSAVNCLFAFGVVRWEKVVTGATADFERLADCKDPEHEQSIRRILSADPSPDRYARQLRDIIAKRAG